MGASSSLPLEPFASAVVSPASGEVGAIRRATRYKDELKASCYPGEVATCYDVFQRGARMAGPNPCFGYRPLVSSVEKTGADGKKSVETVVGDYTWMTYSQIAEKVTHFGSGVVHLGLVSPNMEGHRLIGLYGKNRWEWLTSLHAAYAYKMTGVPLYDTLGVDAISYITNQTGLQTVCCSSVETAKLISFKRERAAELATLVNVVQWEDVSEEARKAASDAGLALRSFTEVCEAGSFNKQPHTPPSPSDMAIICYTSGTTGNPKGAILSHQNMVADASGAKFADLGICKDDVHLCYLPLAHVFEQLVSNALLMEGAQIGFFQGDTLKIMDDIKALRPTIFPSVPRLFNRIYDRITGNVQEAGGMKLKLFNKGFAAKRAGLQENHITHGFWDSLVFGKVAGRVGLDRCRLMVSGSAPLAPHVMEFMRIVFSTRFVEGYGQTECGGAASVTAVADQATIGHVGGPMACNEITLMSVPDLGYLVTDTVHGREVDASGKVLKAGIACEGRGEVCYRGPNIFPGYYRDAEKTAEALDADGWLHSGDIGLWDATGHLRIIDRKKNMFKLSQGEYVAAEKIENIYLGNFVQQVFVYGDSLHSMLVGIVIPNPDAVRVWASSRGLEGTPLATLVQNADLKKAIFSEMIARGKAGNLVGFEQVKDIHLDAEPWTPEDILTPTFKLKRADAKRRYIAQIDAMYSVLDPVAGARNLHQGDA